MRRLLAGAAIALGLALATDAAACRSNRDCPPDARCIPTFGQPEGVCERGLSPVDGFGPVTPSTPNDGKGREGQRCQFPSDCAVDLTCVSQGAPGYRVCSR
jgi:hypothetical protein